MKEIFKVMYKEKIHQELLTCLSLFHRDLDQGMEIIGQQHTNRGHWTTISWWRRALDNEWQQLGNLLT